jgi:hypothetical protein
MNRRATVGFDRRLNLEWLDAAAGQVAAGASPPALRAYLSRMLEGEVNGSSPRGASAKTVTVLVRVWSQVPLRTKPLRDRALDVLPHLTPDERLAAHWALVVAAYPFFTDVAGIAGRLLALQGEFTLVQLTQRIASAWGERTTTARAAQRVVRSMVQWGVLADTPSKGVYEIGGHPRVVTPDVAEILIEALLLDAGDVPMALPQLLNHPALFPFQLTVTVGHLRRAPRLDVQRQGLDVDVVALAEMVTAGHVQRQIW